ncbi:T9SS type A sorting domain-containing protein [Aequorivita nionensis]|uniref:T9SS type A sorting domain-containing protein n=1 Tax=Aequorivita nionensis TaxID=1287690 RepID=UPI003965C5E0
MKKITFLVKSIFALSLLMGVASMEAQVEFKLQTEMFTRFNDVNDNGQGVTTSQYYDFATNVLTDMEPEATGLTSINNNGDVSGQMYFDEPNGIMQPAVKKNGTWTPIGWFPASNPAESGFTTYGISPNSKYVTGQMSIGCCDFGTFLYDTDTGELFDVFDPNGETLTGYAVTDDGTMGGWLDQPNGGGTLRVPAFFNKDGDITLIPDGQLPTFITNSIVDINSANVMVGDFDGQPFIYDSNTATFTTFDTPEGNGGTFTSISDNGIVIGYEDVDFQVREAIIYHPDLGPQPLFLKDVLSDLGVTIGTADGKLGTAYKISDNGNYVAGWVNGPPVFAEGWMAYLDDSIILGTQDISQNTVSFYPNPVQNTLHLNSKEAIDAVSIYTVTGQMVSNVTFNETRTELNLSSLASGVYLVKVTSNGSVENLKVVKQ